MSAQTLPLFDANKMSIDEKVKYLEGLADKKFKDFHLTLGYFKTKNFNRSHNALLVGLKQDNKTTSQSIEGTSFDDMVNNVIAFLENQKI